MMRPSAGLQQNDVAGHQFVGVQHGHFAVAQNLAGRGGHGLQRLNRRLGLALLKHAQHGVEQHHRQNDDRLRPFAFARNRPGQGADSGRGQQDEQHRILQLRQKALPKARLFSLLQLVGAILRQALRRPFRRQTCRFCVQFVQRFINGQFIIILHQHTSFSTAGAFLTISAWTT